MKILITGGAGTVGSSFINEYYKDIQQSGGGRFDTSCLLKRLEELT